MWSTLAVLLQSHLLRWKSKENNTCLTKQPTLCSVLPITPLSIKPLTIMTYTPLGTSAQLWMRLLTKVVLVPSPSRPLVSSLALPAPLILESFWKTPFLKMDILCWRSLRTLSCPLPHRPAPSHQYRIVQFWSLAGHALSQAPTRSTWKAFSLKTWLWITS